MMNTSATGCLVQMLCRRLVSSTSPRKLQLPCEAVPAQTGKLVPHSGLQLLERILQIKPQAPNAGPPQLAGRQVWIPFLVGVSRTSSL